MPQDNHKLFYVQRESLRGCGKLEEYLQASLRGVVFRSQMCSSCNAAKPWYEFCHKWRPSSAANFGDQLAFQGVRSRASGRYRVERKDISESETSWSL